MIRLSLRQFRIQATVAAGLLLVIAIMLISTRPHIAHLYALYAKAQAACATSGAGCRQITVNLSQFDKNLELIGTALVALPAILGAFWGAPLISRELENETHRLVWTQSVTRQRWLTVKLAVVVLAGVVTTGLLSLMVTWWSSPIDHANADRFGAGLFGERNIAPLGYTAFALTLGISAGAILRRTLPAMATAAGLFLAVRLGFTYLIRPHLIPAKQLTTSLDAITHGFGSSNGGPENLFLGRPELPGAWVYSTRAIDASGRDLSSATTMSACPNLSTPPSDVVTGATHVGPVQAPAGSRDALQECVATLSARYHGLVSYQPASRYWIFQWTETAIYLALAVLLIWLCFHWIRSRAR